MLKKRLIPNLLIRHRQLCLSVRPFLVTTKGFSQTIEVGDAVSQAKIYEAQLADELVVLNIDRTPIDKDDVTLELIERLASETFMPLCVGGGVNTVEDFSLLLDRGADKVSINTAAMRTPQLITQAADRFGAQCVVVSIDYRVDAEGRAWVHDATQAWSEARELAEWAQRAVAHGAGELLLCDVERDGSGEGLSWQACREVSGSVGVPVILSGGCGRSEHFVEGIRDGHAEGIAAGTFFSFRDQNPMQTRAHLRNAGIAIRMET